MQDLIPGSRRFPGEENGNPPHYSCLGTPQTEEPGGLESMASQWVRHDRDGERLHCMYGRASFYCVSLYCTLQTLHFLHIEGSSNTGLRKPIFSIASAHFASLCPILVILAIFRSFPLSLYLLWRRVIRDLWCHYWNCFGHHKPQPYTTVNLVSNIVCVLTSPLTGCFCISHLLLGPPCSLRHNKLKLG